MEFEKTFPPSFMSDYNTKEDKRKWVVVEYFCIAEIAFYGTIRLDYLLIKSPLAKISILIFKSPTFK